MDERIKLQAFAHLGIDPEDAVCLGGYDRNVYLIGGAYVLKLISDAVSPRSDTLSELEWIDHLHREGLSVAKPIPFHTGDLVTDIGDGWHAAAFENVHGEAADRTPFTDWEPGRIAKWGETTGRMHAASFAYRPRHPRRAWYRNPVVSGFGRVPLAPEVRAMWARYVEELHAMPEHRDRFGLVHGDLHAGNLIVHGNELTVIDFGDMEYHFFAYDIAVAVYHAALGVPASERSVFARSFLESFMTGYNRRHPADGVESQVEYFMKFRRLFSYTYHAMFADWGKLSEEQRRYLREMEQSIMDDLPLFE